MKLPALAGQLACGVGRVGEATKGTAMDTTTVTQDFPIIRLGLGQVEIGNATHEGLPALWVGRGGRGLGAPVMHHNRPANEGETLVLFTFADIRGLEAMEDAIARLRADMTPNAPVELAPTATEERR